MVIMVIIQTKSRYGVSAGKRDQIEIFFKKKFLSKIDVDLIIWSRTFVILKKNFLSIWSLFPALTPYYDLEFVTIAGASDKLILEEESEDFIIVLPNITQHGRIRIGSEIFGANIAPDIERIHTYWQSLYKIMKRLIRFHVKFNFTLHIQLIFQLVQKRINWLLSNGTNLRQTLRPDFTAKPMMMMMKDAILSFGRTSVTKLIEIVLFLFITFIADLYLVNL